VKRPSDTVMPGHSYC